ncbi:MAG: hypothetical protein LBG11_06475, partial [Bifidobacteriaceae bacterium]|nr:hypothetical protein [Bifidobacteriaceae bacterium]
MKRHSAIAALKAANPVPDAPAAEPLLRRRAQTAWVAVAVGVAAAATAVAIAVAAPQLAGLPAAQPSDTASAPASPTAIPAESQSPPNPEAVEPVAPAPPDRWPLSGQVLGA